MSLDTFIQNAKEVAQKAVDVADKADALHKMGQDMAIAQSMQDAATYGVSPFIIGLTIFVMAAFVGYYVVWKVTPALHSPLMAITNAISSVIIVGALLAAGLPSLNLASIMGFIAVVLASINIFGGFLVTRRMLSMFSGPRKKATATPASAIDGTANQKPDKKIGQKSGDNS